MKKSYFIITILLCLLLAFAGCGAADNVDENNNNNDNTADQSLLNEYNLRCSDYQAEYEIVDGVLFGRGYNYNLILGDDYGEFYDSNVKIAENVIHVEAQSGTLLYLTADGKVYGLGMVDNTAFNSGAGADGCISEAKLLFDECRYFSMTSRFAVGVKNDNSLWWFWGESLNGQGTIVADSLSEPIKLADSVKFAKAFFYNTAWIDDHDSLYICGDDSRNQIGNGGEKGSGFPTLYKDIVTEPYLALENCVSFEVTDREVIYAKTADGGEYMWGNHHSTAPTLKSKELPDRTERTEFGRGVTWQDHYGTLHSDDSVLTYYVDQSEEPPYDSSVITKTSSLDSKKEKKIMKSNLVPPFKISLIGGSGITISSENDDCLYLLSYQIMEGGMISDISLSVLYDHYAMPLYVKDSSHLVLALPNSPNELILNTFTFETEEGEPLRNLNLDNKPNIDQNKAESLALNTLSMDKYKSFGSKDHIFSTVSSTEFLFKPEFVGGVNTWVTEDYFENYFGDWFWKVTVNCADNDSCSMTVYIDAEYGKVAFISNN